MPPSDRSDRMPGNNPAELPHAWVASVEAARERQMKALTFQEVRRALQALSSLYVERRGARLADGAALDGAGKRAAFGLYYAPLHFALVNRIARELGGRAPARIFDLGCGTGAAGAGWALAHDPPPAIVGVDRDSRVLDEARSTWASLGLRGRAQKGDATRFAARGMGAGDVAGAGDTAGSGQGAGSDPGRAGGSGLLAAFLVNELAPETRGQLLEKLLEAAAGGAQVLVVEPIARRLTPWWPAWSKRFLAIGGREDDWKIEAALPPITLELGRAAGLHALPVTGRSLAAGFRSGNSSG